MEFTRALSGRAVSKRLILTLCVGAVLPVAGEAKADAFLYRARGGRVTDTEYYGRPGYPGEYFGWPGIYYTSDGHYDRSYRPFAYHAADVYAPTLSAGGAPKRSR